MITYLYVKTHTITGLKYLGKTVAKDPHKYPGSGKYWQLHLKKHGKLYTTEILKECQHSALVEYWGQYYSDLWNIVDSDEWANLKPEVGDGGGLPVGHILSDATKRKIGDANRGRKMSDAFCKMRSEKQKGKIPWNKGKTGVQIGTNRGRKFGTPSDEYRANMSNILKGKSKPPRSKQHCENISKAKLGHGHPQTDDSKTKISDANKGRRRMHNDELGIPVKMVPADRIAEFLLNGWKFNRKIV